MTDLTQLHCEPCRTGAQPLNREEIKSLSDELPLWKSKTVDGVEQLTRQYRFNDFQSALDFANLVGALAEEEEHHPTLLVEWGKATVTWWTHQISGLHRNDFIMAAKTDRLLDG